MPNCECHCTHKRSQHGGRGTTACIVCTCEKFELRLGVPDPNLPPMYTYNEDCACAACTRERVLRAVYK